MPYTERSITDQQAADKVRQAVRDEFPGTQIYFFVGGIVKRILNFGSAAPIDVEIVGYDLDAGGTYAKQLLGRLRGLSDARRRPLLTDLQISREENYPELDVVVDREKAGVLGLTEQQVAQTVLTSLSGSSQFAPIPYIDAKTGNQYNINVRLDDAWRRHVQDLSEVFVKAPGGQLVNLANIATVHRDAGPVLVNRKYLQRIIDVTANVAPGQDLGAASAAVQKAVDELPAPDGFTVQLGGQTQAQREAFSGLIFAAMMAIALVYMILASQFRSLVDPLVIMFSVPLGISGVFAALYLTGTTLVGQQLHGHHHDGGHRGLQRRAAGGLRPRAAGARQAAPGGHRGGRQDPAAPHPHDHHRHHRRAGPHGAGHRRGQRDQPAAGPGGHRRPDRLHRLHALPHPRALHAAGALLAAARGRGRRRPAPAEVAS